VEFDWEREGLHLSTQPTRPQTQVFLDRTHYYPFDSTPSCIMYRTAAFCCLIAVAQGNGDTGIPWCSDIHGFCENTFATNPEGVDSSCNPQKSNFSCVG
jgi:hypothetical protein